MKLITIKIWFSILFVSFSLTASGQNKSNYASVLASANWGWQSRDGVEYGKASFDDLYGNPQTISIAKYSSESMYTMLYDKEYSTMGTDGLAAEAGATVAINGSYFNTSNLTSCTALWIDGIEIATTTEAEFARCNGVLCFKDG